MYTVVFTTATVALLSVIFLFRRNPVVLRVRNAANYVASRIMGISDEVAYIKVRHRSYLEEAEALDPDAIARKVRSMALERESTANRRGCCSCLGRLLRSYFSPEFVQAVGHMLAEFRRSAPLHYIIPATILSVRGSVVCRCPPCVQTGVSAVHELLRGVPGPENDW